MSDSVSNELIAVKNLINESKFEDALQLINDIGQNPSLTPKELLRSKVYRGFSHFFLGQFVSALKLAEEIFQESQELNLLLFSLDSLFLKENIVGIGSENIEEYYTTLELHKQIFESIPREDSLEFKEREAHLLINKSLKNRFEGKFNLSLEESRKSLNLLEEIDPRSYFIFSNLMGMASAYQGKGELKLALECNEKAFSLIPEGEYFGINLQRVFIYRNLGVIYFQKGEFDRALEYYKRDFEISKKFGSIAGMCIGYCNIIEVLLHKKDLTQALDYFQQFKQLSKKIKQKQFKVAYQISYALILKSSPRIHDRVEAENIMKKVIEENIEIQTTNMALINLCDWYFEEFQISNQMEILEDIQPLIDQLLRNAKQQYSYSILTNAKLLQAKVALIQINIAEARKLLSEAQNIADEHDLQRLAEEISREHDRLLEELKLWKSLKKTQTPISERLKLASVDDVIDRMQGRFAIEPLDPIEEQPVVLLILIKSNILLLSYPFSEKWKQDDEPLESFLSAFSIFREEYLSQGLKRAKFGEETLLLQSLDSFLICYLFRGQAYSAKQKVNFFSEALIKDSYSIETLKSAVSNGETINASDNPHIEELIVKSFMTDTDLFQTPFKAYTGDEPFVFASYAHSDKLDVYPIIDYLNNTNIKIWYDEGIPISENWKKSIAVNLEKCSAFLVFITPHIINSEYVRKEISFALKKKKPFFAVYLNETKLPAELEFEIADIQAMMMYLMPKSEFHAKLKELLNNSLNN